MNTQPLPTVPQQVEALDKFQKEVLAILSAMQIPQLALSKYTGIMHIEIASRLEDFPPFIHLDSRVEVVCTNVEVDELGFSVGRIVHYPGVHRFADGSGEPPSDDIVDERTTTSAREAAKWAIEMVMQARLNDALQTISDREMAERFKADGEETF